MSRVAQGLFFTIYSLGKWCVFFGRVCPANCLAETTSLTLGLEQSEDVTITHWSLDVTDDGPSVIVEELDTDLGDVTTGTGAAKDLHDTCVARLFLRRRRKSAIGPPFG